MTIDYPQWLEEWWVKYACDQFGCSSLGEREAQIIQMAQNLSDRFTTHRTELSSDYGDDPKLLAAYGLYFFPENFIRVQFVISELMQRGWQPPKQLTLLDLGAGTGAASFSIAHTLASSVESLRVLAVDRSNTALQIANRIAEHTNVSFQIHKGDLLQATSDQKYDLIISSFALNESDLPLLPFVKKTAKELSDNGLLLILEPAMQQTSEAIEQLRDEVTQKRMLHIWAPCVHESRCPMLRANKFWCHEVRHWKPPESLLFLNRHLQRQLNVLKFSFLALGKQPPESLGPNAYRIVSPVTRVKGKWLWEGCASDGNIHEYRLLKRKADVSELEKIKRLERGDIVESKM